MAEHSPQTMSAGRRGKNRNLAHKAYMSESDIPGAPGAGYDYHQGPQTPQKSVSGSPAPPVQSTSNSASRQRSKNRPRPKNLSTSPEPGSVGRDTPPHTATMPKSTAFAGATFHASPAPSALPIPSFFAKLNPDSPSVKDINRNSQPQHSTTDDAESSTPPRPQPSTEAKESPLEIIFRADRAEKERARRASSANSFGPSVDPQSPPSQLSPEGGLSFQPGAFNSRQQPARRSGGISSTELNGTPGQPVGPAFSTPYHERIRASRTGATATSPGSQTPKRDEPRQDRSEALKQFLFNGKNQTPPARATPPAPANNYPGPSTPDGNTEAGRPADLRAMEDSLRRILKLDSPVVPDKPSDPPVYS